MAAKRYVDTKKQLEQMLNRYVIYKKMMKEDELMINNLYSLKSIDYSKTGSGQGNQFFSETENQLIKKVELEERIEKHTRYATMIDMAMRILDEVERKIIQMYYIKKSTWVEISLSVHVSERQCHRLRENALKKMSHFLFMTDY